MSNDVPVQGAAAGTAAASAGVVLLTLSAGQFLMALDSSVMNVSIATVAEDLGTTVTGIQSAITLYTLVMASLMITGGKVGQIYGRKRVFAVGCVVYGAGSLVTSLAPNLTVLLIGWSVLEGVGAALIMPAVVALVASNFGPAERPRAYGMIAAAGAVAVAAGPLLGGLLTTYASWRYVFAGEVVIVALILLLARRIADLPPEGDIGMDHVGTALSALGLGLVVMGVIRSGVWGLVLPKPGAPSWLGFSPVIVMVLAGGLVLVGFLRWESRRLARGRAVLVDPAILRVDLLRAGLSSFFFQYLLLAGLFFVVPLFLSVSLGLSAVETGIRILPLSVTLLLGAVGIPRFFPHAAPRRVVRLGFGALVAGIAGLALALEVGVGAEVVTWPMLLAGLGVGALASQLGSVTVSSVPDERSAEVGGLQNTITFLGSSVGTAFSGALLVSALTTSFLGGIQGNPDVPEELSSQAQVELGGGVPFIPDARLEEALAEVGVTGDTADAIVEENAAARVDGLRTALAALTVLGVVALMLTGGLPQHQPGRAPAPPPPADRPPADRRGRRDPDHDRAHPVGESP